MTISSRDKLTLITNLATMLGSGIPLLEAIEAQLEDSKGSQRKMLELCLKTLSNGQPISQAFAKAPKAFDPVTISLVKAAEEAGTLDTTLKDLAKNIKREMSFNDRVRASLTYPVFVLAVFAGVLLLILTFVMPRLARVFAGLRVELPAATRFLMRVSDILTDNYLLIGSGFVGLSIILILLYRANKRAFVNALLKLPLLSRLGRRIDLARFTRSFGLLLGSGIPIVQALELAEATTTKREIRHIITQAAADIEAGKPFGQSLRKKGKGIIPTQTIQIIEAAEESGTLEPAMQELSEFYETEVDNSLKTISTLIEPVMLVVVGLLVGGMMLAVIAPIYNLISQVNAR